MIYTPEKEVIVRELSNLEDNGRGVVPASPTERIFVMILIDRWRQKISFILIAAQ